MKPPLPSPAPPWPLAGLLPHGVPWRLPANLAPPYLPARLPSTPTLGSQHRPPQPCRRYPDEHLTAAQFIDPILSQESRVQEVAGVGAKIMMGAFAGPMSQLLGKLTSLMGKEYAKLKGVRKQVEFLAKELISINIALEKYATMEKPDVQVKVWMKEVQELAEDCIDMFTYRVNHEPANKTIGIKGFLRKNIHMIKKLHYRHKFVGINSPTEEIINRFIEEESGPRKQRRVVVSIVGSGGLGKTTLSNQVYQKIKGRFDCTVFVSVSRNPDMNCFLWGMLSEVDSTRRLPRLANDWQLINTLRECLENKRFPKWINCSLSELSYLDINIKLVEEEDLSMLEDLLALHVLCLFLNRIPEGLTVSSSGFQCLTEFHLNNMNGPGIMFEAGAMPKVQIVFRFDAYESVSVYGGFDFGVQPLSSLRHIKVEINYTHESHFLIEAAECHHKQCQASSQAPQV